MPRKILKTVYNALLVSLILFVTLQFTACSNLPEPVPTGEKLPFGVFPLNDVKWEYVRPWGGWDPSSYDIYDSVTGKPIFNVWFEERTDYSTFFLKQISENQAELYETLLQTKHIKGWDYIKQVEREYDTNFTYPVKLYGNILLEDKKVYYQNQEIKVLMYDFSLNVGDTFAMDPKIFIEYKYSVTSIDSIMVGNEYRKQYNFDILPIYNAVYNNFSVIEGIGVIFYNFFFTITDPGIHWDPEPATLERVYYKEQLIWSAEDYWRQINEK